MKDTHIKIFYFMLGVILTGLIYNIFIIKPVLELIK